MFVRNNLTGVELLEMTARGVHGELRFGTTAMMSGARGASAESGGLLKFEVKEKHLKDCYRKFCSINIGYNIIQPSITFASYSHPILFWSPCTCN